MARRTIYVDDIERVQSHLIDADLEPIESIGVGKHAYDYVHFQAEGPLAGLIWKEVRKILKKARLTDLQAVVTELYLLGKSDAEIAIDLETVDGIKRSRQAIRYIRINANAKLNKIQNIGLLTVLYEEFGRDITNKTQKTTCQ